jgi:hypothetical protein
VKRLEREVERLERELVNARFELDSPMRRNWAKGAVPFFTAKLEQTCLDLEALRRGVWS